jgi:hypothetical protein
MAIFYILLNILIYIDINIIKLKSIYTNNLDKLKKKLINLRVNKKNKKEKHIFLIKY